MDEKPTTAEPRTKPRRRWYQFRLRTLLIGVVLLGLPLGYVVREVTIVRQRQAWKEILQ